MKAFGTTVTFYRRSDGNLIGYRAKGHTGFAVAGADIICAGISALTQCTLNGLKNVLKAPVMFDINDHEAFLEACLTPEATETQIQQAQLLLVTLQEGIEAIHRSYPKNVRIFFEERR